MRFTKFLQFTAEGPGLQDFINATSYRHPDWMRFTVPRGQQVSSMKQRLSNLNLNTVCVEAKCPNIGKCWAKGTATIMLLGDECTRACRFCSVKTSKRPKFVPTEEEAVNTAEAIAQMNLKYVVLTSVDRDDLPDQGSLHFCQTVRHTKKRNPFIKLECLTPDFQGNTDLIDMVATSGLDVYSHNIETVRDLQWLVRDPRASFKQSLSVLERAKRANVITKSGMMLGLGETDSQIEDAMKSLRDVGVDILTIGQYLQPSKRHLKVREYVRPEKFLEWKEKGESVFKFKYVASGPLVRSSFEADEGFEKAMEKLQSNTDDC
ncbi:hypothetical protein GJ496_007172 [Pomphorhynchus laevis]|nr:hypothetical protein GJ496_007172 [Pomphorhynchus laevis]